MSARYRAAKSVARVEKSRKLERREARALDRKEGAADRKVCRAASPAAHGVSQTPAFPGAPLPLLGGADEKGTRRPPNRAAERWLDGTNSR